MDKILDIVSEEVGISREELDEDMDFTDLGVDDILAQSIVSKIAQRAGLHLTETTFNDYPTVDSLRAHLQDLLGSSVKSANHGKLDLSSQVPKNPLSILLQGKGASARAIIFLLPDGSGSATAYLRLPAIDPNICVIGMNSPYLDAGKNGRFSVEGIAAIWGDEIRRRKPKGPYILGGWSAGGYYSFEVAKYLIGKGEKVKKLVLIDSPCRLSRTPLFRNNLVPEHTNK